MSPGPMLGGMQATEESLRFAVCQEAAARLVDWPGKSSDHDQQVAIVRGIWDGVIEHNAPSMYGKAWCGAFALTCLRAAGVADGVWWVPGEGFLERHCAHTLPPPQQGDIAYFAEPYQHHAIVIGSDGRTFDSIDGNQPGILRHLGRPIHAAMFYSIAPLLRRALAAVAG